MLKVKEVTKQPQITLKLKVFCKTDPEKFDEFTVRINGCVPKSVGETRRFLLIWIPVLDPTIDM